MDVENNCYSSEEVHVFTNSNNTTPQTHEADDEEEEEEEEVVRAWVTLEEKVTKLKLKLSAAREVIRQQQGQISELRSQLESKKASQMCQSNSNQGLQGSSLAEFFSNIGLSHYLSVFVKEDFDMESLQLLDENELKDMEIPRGPRLKIIQQIKKLKASPVAAPSSPASLHIPSVTVVTLATDSDDRPLPLVAEHNGMVDQEDSGVEPEEGKDGEETEGEDNREEERDEDGEEGENPEKQQEEERTWLNPTAKQRRKSGEVSAEDLSSAVQQESKEREREKRNNKRLSNEVWKKKQEKWPGAQSNYRASVAPGSMPSHIKKSLLDMDEGAPQRSNMVVSKQNSVKLRRRSVGSSGLGAVLGTSSSNLAGTGAAVVSAVAAAGVAGGQLTTSEETMRARRGTSGAAGSHRSVHILPSALAKPDGNLSLLVFLGCYEPNLTDTLSLLLFTDSDRFKEKEEKKEEKKEEGAETKKHVAIMVEASAPLKTVKKVGLTDILPKLISIPAENKPKKWAGLVYERHFTGAGLVDWLLEEDLARSRMEAMMTCNLLMQSGVIVPLGTHKEFDGKKSELYALPTDIRKEDADSSDAELISEKEERRRRSTTLNTSPVSSALGERKREAKKEKKERRKKEKEVKKKQKAEKKKQVVGKKGGSRIALQTKKIFGGKLEDIMALQAETFPTLTVPVILHVLKKAIFDLEGNKTVGLFRIPGNNDRVNEWVKQLNEQNYEIVTDDVNVVGTTMKKWIRDLAEPLIPSPIYFECIELMKSDCQDKAARGWEMLERLPPLNKAVIYFLLDFLKELAKPENSTLTKMDADNLGMVFAPLFLCCPDTSLLFSNNVYEASFVQNLISSDPPFPLSTSSPPSSSSCTSPVISAILPSAPLPLPLASLPSLHEMPTSEEVLYNTHSFVPLPLPPASKAPHFPIPRLPLATSPLPLSSSPSSTSSSTPSSSSSSPYSHHHHHHNASSSPPRSKSSVSMLPFLSTCAFPLVLACHSSQSVTATSIQQQQHVRATN